MALKEPAKRKQNPRSKRSTAIMPLTGYDKFLRELKGRIRSAQIKAALSVNSELIQLYWEIGRRLIQQQEEAGWGDAMVEQLARDLRREFPGLKGFSRSNIFSESSPFLVEILA